MFYLFHGDDTHSKKRTLDLLKAKAGDAEMLSLNTNHIEGKTLTLTELKNVCNAMPFLSPKRLVIVDDWLSSKPPKDQVKKVAAYLVDLPATTNLIFMESKAVRKTNAIYKLAESDKKLGFVKLFERPQGNQLNGWIRKQVQQRGGTIAPQAVQMLAINVGNDLQALENEVEKLTLYKGEDLIQAGDVERLGAYSAESNIFDLVDALGSRNGRNAVTLLQKQLADGTDPFYLFSMFVRQFRLLIQARECVERRLRPPEIAKEIGCHSFVAGKLSKQAASFTLPQLEKLYLHLLDIDVGVKTGKTDMVTALSLLIATLAS